MKGESGLPDNGMKKVSVLIVSYDEDYCANVLRYFRNHYSDSVTAVSCCTVANIPEYITNNSISIILCDEVLFEQVSAAVGGKCVVYRLAENKQSADERSIAKYISAPALYNELVFIYAKFADEERSVNTFNRNLYTFISANGCGATVLSVSFARRLAREGKKVLYIGLDGLSDYCSIFSCPAERGLSDIIMALKSKSANIALTAKSVTNIGEVSFIDKCRCFDDVYEIDNTEVESFFNSVFSSGDYDAVIMDMCLAYINVWNYAAKNSKCIFCVSTNRTSAIAKTNNFIETVKIRDYRNSTDAFSRLRVIVNRSASFEPCTEISCEKVSFVQRYSAENYDVLTSKVADDNVWSEYIEG